MFMVTTHQQWRKKLSGTPKRSLTEQKNVSKIFKEEKNTKLSVIAYDWFNFFIDPLDLRMLEMIN